MDEGKALLLRTCSRDMTSRNGFTWPRSGRVEAPDWDPEPRCGRGLHGLLWGEGDVTLLDPDGTWLAVQVDAADVVDLGGKVKVPRGDVMCCGERDEVIAYITERAPSGAATAYGTATAGDHGTATAGAYGTATAGYRGTAIADDHGTATAGADGIIQVAWWDDEHSRYRIAIGYVGEDGIDPGVPYRCDKHGDLARGGEQNE